MKQQNKTPEKHATYNDDGGEGGHPLEKPESQENI
jgi:hypothetical protein